MYPQLIQKLIKEFSNFPTVGPRTGARFVFYLIKTPQEKVARLIKLIEQLKNKIKICPLCFNSFEVIGKSIKKLCPICANETRDKTVICVVEKEIDLEAIEKIKKFKGVYFVLGGTISDFRKEKEKKEIEEKVEKLEKRIREQQPKVKEIILALNPTTEGENTSFWLKRRLKSYNIKITQLGRGLPVGGELEYADEETLSSALEKRE